MKKRFLVFVLVLLLITTIVFANSEVKGVFSDVIIKLNGETLVLKDANNQTLQPVIINGSTYLPVRAISENLGLDVGWDGKTRTVSLTKKTLDTDVVKPGTYLVGKDINAGVYLFINGARLQVLKGTTGYGTEFSAVFDPGDTTVIKCSDGDKITIPSGMYAQLDSKVKKKENYQKYYFYKVGRDIKAGTYKASSNEEVWFYVINSLKDSYYTARPVWYIPFENGDTLTLKDGDYVAFSADEGNANVKAKEYFELFKLK